VRISDIFLRKKGEFRADRLRLRKKNLLRQKKKKKTTTLNLRKCRRNKEQRAKFACSFQNLLAINGVDG